MAKSANGNTPNSGRIKFRVIEFEVEGGDDRLADGLKAITAALSRPAITVPSKTIAMPQHRASLPSEIPQEELAEPEAEELVEEDDIPRGTSVDKVGPARTRKAPRAPKFLSELNLSSASVTLKDFMAEKGPEETQARYVVIAEWFKEYFATPEISADHIYTAYTDLGWKSQLPPDPSQPLRDLKYKKNWMDAGARGMYKINWKGTDTVNKMKAGGGE